MEFDTRRSVRSLQKHAPGDALVYVQVTLRKQIAERRQPVPVIIPLPNRFRRTADLSICLVTRDPVKKYTDVLLADKSPAAETFAEITSVSKLRRRLRTKKQKEEFRAKYDMLLAEANVMELLPEILGWEFYKSGRKMPLPVQLISDKTKQVDPQLARYQARKLTKSTALAIVPGTCLSVVAGSISMDEKELIDNVDAAARAVTDRVGKLGVIAVHIKTPESASLPLWTKQ